MQSIAGESRIRVAYSRRLQILVMAGLGIAAFGAVWEFLGREGWLGTAWPALSEVIKLFGEEPMRDLLFRSLKVTATEAALGYVLGVSTALLSAGAGVFWKPLRAGMLNFAAVLQAIPVVALGPLLMAVFPREATPVVLATLTVYFTMFLSASVGFASTPAAREDLLTTLGSSAVQRFWRVQLPSAVPTLLAGLKYAAPTALLGAILGEWFGTESGIGPIIVIAMQNFRIELLWAAALVVSVTSMVVYGLLSVGERVASDRYG